MSDTHDEVRLMAAELHIGDTKYYECPACGRDNKMGVTRQADGLLFHCFSTACGEKGFAGDGWTRRVLEGHDKPEPKPRRYVGDLLPLTEEDKLFFEAAWGLQPHSIERYIYATVKDEYLMPIYQAEAYVGEVVRQPVWKGHTAPRKGRPGLPKALTYIEKRSPRLAFYRRYPVTQRIVLVEDQLSALKVSEAPGLMGVALLGNSFAEREVEMLRSFGAPVSIWLDPDMHGQAFELNAKYGQSFEDCKVVLSDYDPKDYPTADIQELIYD